MLLEGIFAPITTPFHADGRLFPARLSTNTERYSRGPVSGLLVLDEAGEGAGLTDDEAEAVLLTAIAAAADEKVMLASVGRESVAATVRLAQIAASAGYDGLVVALPHSLNAATMPVEAATYFRAIADAVSAPIVLASDAAHHLDVELVSQLAEHPNVVALIDKAADPARVAAIRTATAAISREATVTTVFRPVTGRMLRASAADGSFVPAASLGAGTATAVEQRPALKTRTRRVGFQILTGDSSGMLDAWQAGASGSVSRFAACAPQATCEVWQAFRDGDAALAHEKQERIRAAAALVEGAAGIAMLKYACDWNAYFGGRPRLPLLAPTAYAREQLEGALAGMRN